MKKVLLIAAFTFAAVSSMAQTKYAVIGTYDGNGKTVYLIDELTERAIDSTVVADGKFAFTGTAAQDALMAVRAKKSTGIRSSLTMERPSASTSTTVR